MLPGNGGARSKRAIKLGWAHTKGLLLWRLWQFHFYQSPAMFLKMECFFDRRALVVRLCFPRNSFPATLDIAQQCSGLWPPQNPIFLWWRWRRCTPTQVSAKQMHVSAYKSFFVFAEKSQRCKVFSKMCHVFVGLLSREGHILVGKQKLAVYPALLKNFCYTQKSFQPLSTPGTSSLATCTGSLLRKGLLLLNSLTYKFIIFHDLS